MRRTLRLLFYLASTSDRKGGKDLTVFVSLQSCAREQRPRESESREEVNGKKRAEYIEASSTMTLKRQRRQREDTKSLSAVQAHKLAPQREPQLHGCTRVDQRRDTSKHLNPVHRGQQLRTAESMPFLIRSSRCTSNHRHTKKINSG